MTIFYLSSCPEKAAQYQYNKHVVKMILESAQLLCTAHNLLDGSDADVPYKSTHKNHPSAVWARQSSANYSWLYFHMLALGDEYTKRYGRQHLTITKCKKVLGRAPGGIFNTGFTEPPQCMPDEYKVEGDSVTAYWNYYENEKHTVRNKNEQIITRPNER